MHDLPPGRRRDDRVMEFGITIIRMLELHFGFPAVAFGYVYRSISSRGIPALGKVHLQKPFHGFGAGQPLHERRQ